MSRKITGTCYCTGEARKLSVDVNGSVFDARIEALVAFSGHFGPWCNQELVGAGITVPQNTERPTPPPAVIEAAKAEEAAEAAFKAADEQRTQAEEQRRDFVLKARRRPMRIDMSTGAPLDDGGEGNRRHKKLQAAAKEALEHREEAGMQLSKARHAYSKACADWEWSLRR